MSERKRTRAAQKNDESIAANAVIESISTNSDFVATSPIKNEHFSVTNKASKMLSDYEQERLENIKRNEKFLATLGINNIKNELASTIPVKALPKRKVVPTKRDVVELPLRRSTRVTAEKLQDEINLLLTSGNNEQLEIKRKELEEFNAKRLEGAYQVVEADSSSSWTRLNSDPISFHDMTYDEDKYDSSVFSRDLSQLLTSMKEFSLITPSPTIKPSSNKCSSLEEYTTRLQKLSVASSDVAKLTESRITSIYVHPSESKTIVLAGDKQGYLGIWDVDKSSTSELHGVYKYRPHISGVAKIHSSELDPASIYSTSYDGTIRHLDLHQEAFTLAFEAPEGLHNFYFTDATFLYDQPSCLYIGANDSSISLVDLRSSAASYQWKHSAYSGYKVNSIQQHPLHPHIIITAEKTAVYIYDARKYSSSSSSSSSKSRQQLPLLTALTDHSHSINAAHISRDGQYIVSVSQDNTIRTWKNFLSNDNTTTSKSKVTTAASKRRKTTTSSTRKIEAKEEGDDEEVIPTTNYDCVVTRHDNHTGRWLSTFRPVFDPKPQSPPGAFLLGSMEQPRRVEVFCSVSADSSNKNKGKTKSTSHSKVVVDDKDEDYSLQLLHNLQSQSLASVCSRNAFHPSLDIIACGNSSGRCFVFRENTDVDEENDAN